MSKEIKEASQIVKKCKDKFRSLQIRDCKNLDKEIEFALVSFVKKFITSWLNVRHEIFIL